MTQRKPCPTNIYQEAKKLSSILRGGRAEINIKWALNKNPENCIPQALETLGRENKLKEKQKLYQIIIE